MFRRGARNVGKLSRLSNKMQDASALAKGPYISVRPMSSVESDKKKYTIKPGENLIYEENKVLTVFEPGSTKKPQLVKVSTVESETDLNGTNDFTLVYDEEIEVGEEAVDGDDGHVICCTNKLLHDKIRDSRALASGSAEESALSLKPGESTFGSITMNLFGTYGGGVPVSLIPVPGFQEQVGPDDQLFASRDMKKYIANREEIDKHGPRISAVEKVSLVENEQGQLETRVQQGRAFVNTTIHRGEQARSDGKVVPVTYYTPGSALKHKTKSSITKLPNGDTIQTVSTLVNAEADVLCHWVLNAVQKMMPETVSEATMSTNKTEHGGLKSRSIKPGIGEKLLHWTSAATGTPFVMSTLTVHRDKDGNVKNFFLHTEGKTWPAAQAIIELSGADGKTQYTLYDSIIPETSKWGELTVAKLALPTMVHNDLSGSLGKDGIGQIEDKKIEELMRVQNEKARFTSTELKEYGVAWTMVGASVMREVGMEGNDPRSRVVSSSSTGEFDYDAITRQHISNDPGSVEYFFCGRAMRILAENLDKEFKLNHHSMDNPRFRELWKIVISPIPGYKKLNQLRNEYAEELSILLYDTPEDVERLEFCSDWAKEAHEANAAANFDVDDYEPDLPFSNGMSF